MLNNFELRFVKREVAGRHIVSDLHEAKIVRILQYRTRDIDGFGGYCDWSDWQDIPTEEE